MCIENRCSFLNTKITIRLLHKSHILSQCYIYLLPSSQVVLSDGSLLLRSVSIESGGDYQCIVWFGNHSLEGPILQLHISEGM